MAVKALIKEQLKELLIPKEKGINLQVYEAVEPNLRRNLTLLKGNRNFNSNTLGKVLSDKELLEIVNSLPASKEAENAIEDIMDSDLGLERVKDCLKSLNIIELVEKIRPLYRDERRRYSTPYNKLGNTIIDTHRFFQKYRDEYWNLAILVNTIAFENIYKNIEVETEKLEFLRFKQYTYPNNISTDALKHFRNNKEDFDFYQFLFDNTSSRDFSTFYRPVRKMISSAENKEELKQKVQQLFQKFDREVINQWFEDLIITEEDTITEHEINRMLRADGSNKDVYAVIYGESSPVCTILTKLKESYNKSRHRNLIKKTVSEKKKAFLRLLSQEKMFLLFNNMGNSNILFEGLFDRVNVNTLNEQNMKTLSKMYEIDKLNMIAKESIITFNEFEALYSVPDLRIQVFYQLMTLSVEDRLKAFRELPRLKTLKKLFKTEEELVERVANLLKYKPFKTIIREKGLNILGATDEQLLAVLVAPEKFERFLDEIKSGSDIKFIINNEQLLQLADSLETLKALFIKRDPETQFMLKEIGLSKAFVNNNVSRIISFHDRGLAKVFKTMHEKGKQTKEQLRNLALITKAELSGKLMDIKFVDQDFELEIGLPVSEQTKQEWKGNRTRKANKFTVQETYDYETTIKIGENPVRSCLSWNDGMYSRCLLSSFDTNKKILIAKDSKGNIVSRAFLRLTKRTDNPLKKIKEKRLGFKDIEIEGETNSVIKEDTCKEELVLFLENSYTSLDSASERSQANLVDAMFIELVKEKAKALGAKLVTSKSYSHEDLEPVDTHIFISYSKNGFQYMDSLGGQAEEGNEGKYKPATILQLKTEE